MGFRSLYRSLRNKTLVRLGINGLFPKFPFGKKPRATAEEYMRLWSDARAREAKDVALLEKECGFHLDREWLDNLALHTQVVVKKSELNWNHGRVLYTLLSQYIEKRNPPEVTVLETGTARGFSAISMARALNDGGVSGKVISLDILPHNSEILWNCIDDLEGPKSRGQLLSSWKAETMKIVFIQGWSSLQLAALGIPRVNFAFLDGAHTYRDVKLEFDYISNRQAPGDLVVFDDVTDAEQEVNRAVMELASDPRYVFSFIGEPSERRYAVAERLH